MYCPPQTILYLRTRHGSYPSSCCSGEHGMAGMIEMKTTAAVARQNAAAEGNSQEAEEDCVDFREDSHWRWRIK